MLAAIPKRETAGDALVSKNNLTLEQLPKGAKIGTSSLRRKAQLLRFRKDLQIVDLRGNIDTRLKKLREQDLDGLVIAEAGLRRMGSEALIAQVISLKIMLPAPGQGALGIEIRRDDEAMKQLVAPLNNAASFLATKAERSFLKVLGGGCQVAIGAFARVKQHSLELEGVVLSPGGEQCIRSQVFGKSNEAEQLGQKLADKVLALGAKELLTNK